MSGNGAVGKTGRGRFLEDFAVGERIAHATPRTVTTGDTAIYMALYGPRFALQSADSFAGACGLKRSPVDDWLAFHVVFGKSVPDISLNAVANLGYADGRWLAPVYPGDSLTADSEVIGLRQNSNGTTGTVYVRTTGRNQHGAAVIDYVRWVMVRKRDPDSPAPETVIPDLPEAVTPDRLAVPEGLDFSGYDPVRAGSGHFWDDYAPGEKIDHVDGMTIEEAEHQLATRLYQNTARVHFDQHRQGQERLGRRLIYGGHVISLARALSFNGLGNACVVAALNGGRHVNPTLAGHTVYAWSQVLDRAELPGRRDAGALRVRTVATRDLPCDGFPDKDDGGRYPDGVVLDLDTWLLLPRRG
ncbi:MaoC family dehydratase [Marinibaculum pumilum]|uniref:MaoC family dehydratase n=1 Tax=Marinibaculum pumilum TaxID=1766165 RepID=A0ABV7L0W1_9PROT